MEKNSVAQCELVLVGGSAGSIDAILQILPALRRDMSFAVIIVIHRKSSFESTLTDLFQAKTKAFVKEAEEKDAIEPGTIYIAPADYHLLIEDDKSLSLDFSEKILHSRPAIDATFQTAAEVYKDKALAILLSGANADGAAGMKAIQDAGGLTIIQDPEDAEIKYMPVQALSRIKPDYVMTKHRIGSFLDGLSLRQ